MYCFRTYNRGGRLRRRLRIDFPRPTLRAYGTRKYTRTDEYIYICSVLHYCYGTCPPVPCRPPRKAWRESRARARGKEGATRTAVAGRVVRSRRAARTQGSGLPVGITRTRRIRRIRPLFETRFFYFPFPRRRRRRPRGQPVTRSPRGYFLRAYY